MAIDLDERGRALENEYFHRKEKELMEKMRVKIQSETSAPTTMECPRCDGKLVETDYEHIKIDVCSDCSGVWLDAGELAQIAVKDEGKGWFGGLFS